MFITKAFTSSEILKDLIEVDFNRGAISSLELLDS